MLIRQLIDVYSLIVLAAVIMSWMQIPPQSSIARVLHMLTEPLLRPLRQILPQMGGLDFSPMILLILLQFLRGMV